ncbi:hypothetical protein Nepgr_028391 [Nepenthes gracilis]|uniref:Uncharacterized protein n=1 Tax=Nepenthes gracilis TaxID=150966 RepID=A0AAD3Y2D3_NEPGR|nr:hypothetical protein Nepgr_028391 [Nepenthes gracilis]
MLETSAFEINHQSELVEDSGAMGSPQALKKSPVTGGIEPQSGEFAEDFITYCNAKKSAQSLFYCKLKDEGMRGFSMGVPINLAKELWRAQAERFSLRMQ